MPSKFQYSIYVSVIHFNGEKKKLPTDCSPPKTLTKQNAPQL